MSTNKELAALIDHTLLKPETTPEMVDKLCDEAIASGFCSVCILPSFVHQAAQRLQDSAVKVCTVIGFPLGANESAIKAIETGVAIDQGADEIDMVINVGMIKAGDWEKVEKDIAAVVGAAKGNTVKVILETCLLDDEEKRRACETCVSVGADFVKTSTGFSSGGATIEDVRLMRETVGPDIGVKASGGVRDLEAAKAMVEAGANRLGTSSGLAIIGASKDGNSAAY